MLEVCVHDYRKLDIYKRSIVITKVVKQLISASLKTNCIQWRLNFIKRQIR